MRSSSRAALPSVQAILSAHARARARASEFAKIGVITNYNETIVYTKTTVCLAESICESRRIVYTLKKISKLFPFKKIELSF